MTRDEVLGALEELVRRGEIKEADMLAAYRRGTGGVVAAAPHFTLNKILYGIGGLVVVAGVIFLIQQMWDSFGPAAQIAVTLGSSIALYIAAVLLHTDQRWREVATLFFVMSAAVMPVGIFVALYHLAPGDNEWLAQLIMAGIPVLIFIASYKLFRPLILLFVSMLFATWALYAIVGLMLDQTTAGYEFVSRVWWYFSLFMGIAHSALAYTFAGSQEKKLAGPLYFIGSALTLGAGFGLTFIQEPWILIYFLFILGAIYLSTMLRSRSLLFFGAIALIAHLIHISFEYFEDSLGWPLALIIAGFIIIGVGYGTVALHKRFIARN